MTLSSVLAMGRKLHRLEGANVFPHGFNSLKWQMELDGAGRANLSLSHFAQE